MNIQQLAENINKHKFHKSQYFSTQSLIVVEYILGKTLKYNGSFYEEHATISEQTGVSVSTIKRAIKRMCELEMIQVQPRRKVCHVTGKTLQSSNLITVLVFKSFVGMKEVVVGAVKEVVSKVVEVVQEVVEKVSQVMKPRPTRPTYNKKPIRTEITPDWLNKPYVKAEETEEVKRQREELIRQIKEWKK